MSIKTLRKRIALVAASTLAAGVVSVVSAPVANAAVLAGTSYNWGSAAGVAYTSATSGFCSQNDTTDVLVVRYPSTLATAGVKLFEPGAGSTTLKSTEYSYFSATGTGYFSAPANDAAAAVDELAIDKSADEKTLTFGVTTGAQDTNSDMPASVTWMPTAAGTTTINLYTVEISSGTATLLETYTLVAASGCTSGEYSPIYSGSAIRTASTALTATTYDDGDDAAGVSVENAVGVSYLGLWLRDGLGDAVTDTASYLNVSATGGCTISGTTTDLSSTSTAIVVTSGITNKVIKLFTSGATSNTCTVTASYNGTEVAKKTVVFKGDAASVVGLLMDYAIGESSTAAGYYNVLDATGARIGSVTSATAVELTGTMVGAAISFAASTSSSTAAVVTIDAVGGSTLRGAGSFKIRVTNNAGAFITSPAINMLVSSGTIDKYTLALDKASYTPGQIISVTLGAKDSGGRIIPDGTTLAAAATALSFTLAGATPLSAAPAHTDTSENGVWTYKYIAGTTTGDWAANLGLSGVATDTAKQATYSIKSATTDVTNAEVLKSIVALIASINKQIAALQKLILKR
jgi:hypothetical protein